MSESNGRKIEAIRFANAAPLEDPWLRESPLSWLQWHEDFHGEYDIPWIVQLDRQGREIARYNPRHIESIIWAVPSTANPTVKPE